MIESAIKFEFQSYYNESQYSDSVIFYLPICTCIEHWLGSRVSLVWFNYGFQIVEKDYCYTFNMAAEKKEA